MYLSISNLFGKTFKDKVNVYCDIKSAAEKVSALVSLLSEKTGQVSALSGQGPEAETVQAIIQKVLEINFSDMVSVLQVNANGFTTTVDLGDVLNLAGVNCELGNVTLGYDMTSHKLTGKALGEGVVINAYAGKEFSAPEGEFLDVSELLGSVTEILSGNVGVNVMLNGGTMEEFLKANNLVDLNGLLAGATLTISGSVDITSLRASVEISLYKERDGGTYYYAHADAYYQYAEGGYGTAYIRLDKLLGADCDIKVMSDISETISSVQKLIESINGGAAVQTLSGAVSESDADSLAAVISGVLGMRLDLIILDMQSSIDGFTVNLNADKLISEILKLTDSNATVPVTIGNIALSYSIADDTLSGSALGGGLTVNVTKGVAVGNAPSGYTDINKVIDLITKAADIANGIRNNEYISFSADAAITLNGTSFALDGKGEVSWAGGVVKNVALDFTLSLSASGAEDKAPAAIKVIYNADAADDKPFIRIAINNYLIDITRNDISETESQIKAIADSVNTLLGNGTTDGGALASLAEAAGMTTAAGAGSSSSVTVVNAELIKAVIGVLNGEGLAGELFTSLLSGSAVTVDELTNSIKVAFGENNDITLGVKNNSLTFDGIIKLENLADIDVSATASYAAINLASDLSEQFESEQYEKYSTAEGDSLIKAVYNYILDCIDTIDVSSFLNGDNYKVSLVLAGNVSGMESLSGVEVQADLFFSDGLVNGEKVSDKLVQIRLKNIKVDGFTMSATASYMGRNLYIAIDQINGTALSGFNVYVSADDLSRAVKNIVELVTNEKVVNFFSGIIGNGEQVSDGVATLSEEGQQSFEDLLVMLLSLDYCKYIDIMPDTNGKVTIAADIGGLLDVFGIQQSAVGKATINTDGNGGLDIDVYRKVAEGEAEPSYGWLRLDALRTEESNIGGETDYSKYINIGFVADLIKDAGKFITSNTDSDGEISSLFTFEGGEIKVNIDLSKLNVSSTLASINSITISDMKLVAGLDDNRSLYFSLEGFLSDISAKVIGITTAVADEHNIAVTYSDGYLTLAKWYQGSSREYWVMTPEFFIDNMFAEKTDTTDSPLRWLCDINSEFLWNDILVANLANVVSGLSSGLSSPDDLYLYNEDGSASGKIRSEELNILNDSVLSDYITGFIASIGGIDYTLGGYSDIIRNLGLDKTKESFYAVAVNPDLTGGVLSALNAAIMRDTTSELGFSGLKAYGSVQEGIVTFSLNINHTGNKVVLENCYDGATGVAMNYTNEDGSKGLDYYFNKTSDVKDGELSYATDMFGGAKVEYDGDGNVTITSYTQRVYKDNAISVTVYPDSSKENGKTYQLRYGSVVHLHDAENIMVEDGVTYIYVMVGEDGQPYTENGTYPEYVTVTGGEEFYKMSVEGEEWKAVTVSVTDERSGVTITVTVYTGTDLDTINRLTFDEYSPAGGWFIDGTNEPFTGPVTDNVNLHAEFVLKEVTVNGVIYEFVTDHYEVKGVSPAITEYYEEGTTLVLENEIDGYPVTKIQANALENSQTDVVRGLQNVVVPENITVIDGRAFRDNYGMKSVVFLADTVTFNNNDKDNSGAKGYPFYGCTTESGGSNWDLNIYYKNMTNTDSDPFVIRNDNVWAYTHNSGWIWLNYNIVLNGKAYDNEFGSITEELPLPGRLLTNLTWDNKQVDAITAEQMASYITSIIDIYTYESTGYSYIEGYEVSVDNNIALYGGTLEVGIIIESGNNWYPVTVNNNLVEGIAAGTYSFNSYKEINGVYFLENGANITLSTQANGGYELVAISSENAEGYYSDNTYAFTAKEGVVIDIFWQKLKVNSITVYSDVPFIYNTVGASGADNLYVITEQVIVDNVLYSDAEHVKAADGYDNYYFLGWAVDGDSYQFVSEAIVNYNVKDISYYAIWGYGGSNKITKYEPNSEDITKLGTVSTDSSGGVSFYGWYTNPEGFNENHKITDGSISGTTVYARWSYTFNVAIGVIGKSDLYVNGTIEKTYENSTYVYTIAVPEQSSVKVEYSIEERVLKDVTGWLSKKRYYTVMNVSITDGANLITYEIKAYKSGDSYYSIGDGDRYLKPKSYIGAWDANPTDELNNEDTCKASGVKINNVAYNIGITYDIQ